MQDFDLYIVTSFGSRVFGGSDVWVNNYFREIIPIKNRSYKILIDNNRKDAIEFWDDSVEFCYSRDDDREVLLQECTNIYLLHIGYTPKSYDDSYSYLDKYVDKIRVNYMHVYPKYAKEYWETVEGRVGPFDLEWFKYVTHNSGKNVWIGIDPLPENETVPNLNWIPNFYEPEWNCDLMPITSNKIGFAARLEPRKNFKYLTGHDVISFTHTIILNKNHPDIARQTFNIEYRYKFLKNFYTMDRWQIFHACYDREPFGYSIFNAIDAGKLPILHKNWKSDLKYRYTASSKEEFDEVVQLILNDPPEQHQAEFTSLKLQLSYFNNKDRWIKDILEVEQVI